MKPVGIFMHSVTEGPGYFATFLDGRGLPWRLIRVCDGEAVPSDVRHFSGLGFMGGPMSVNDDLPWIAPELQLIRDAVREDVPVIGHCLGGQLISKALGGEVSSNPVKEIGWGQVTVTNADEGSRWLGPMRSFESFHWHGETFTIPPGATHFAGSAACANQMYALGKHLGMQCHVEMTEELIAAWCLDWDREVTALAQRVPSVQTPGEMLTHVAEKTAALNAVARRIYLEWLTGLRD